MVRLPLVAAVSICAALAGPARADTLSFAGGGDVRVVPEVGGNGFVLAAWTRPDTLGGTFLLAFNTDTLHVALERVRLSDNVFAGVYVRGEALIAGLLTNYYVHGLRVPERGFFASYLQLGAHAETHFQPSMTVELDLQLTRWFFGATDDSLFVPDDIFSFAPTVRLTHWRVTSDARELAIENMAPRIEGYYLRAEATSEVRDSNQSPAILLRQSAVAGYSWGDTIYLRVREHAGYGAHADDLNRTRLGGTNIWVVPLFGVPWAAWVSDRYVAAEVLAHLRLGDHLVGAGWTGALISDIDRDGHVDRYGSLNSLGVVADFRYQQLQVVLRAGWAPPQAALAERGMVSAFASLSYALSPAGPPTR